MTPAMGPVALNSANPKKKKKNGKSYIPPIVHTRVQGLLREKKWEKNQLDKKRDRLGNEGELGTFKSPKRAAGGEDVDLIEH